MKKALQHFAILAIGFSLTCTTPLLGQGRYVRLQGKVLSQQPESNIHSFHLDAYKITKDGQRQLVRLSRFSGPDYHLYLEAEFDHEVLIQMMDHAPYLVKIDGVASGADQTERLVLNQDFIVPVNQPSGNAVASAKPKPPALPEAHITYLQVYEESGDLLEQWG
ncbi:MAG: hypothetical protein HRU12_17955, partial [Phaeodactylibacter sp.]|nr:hypothetical protein [Phaeodactylibacter sp.]